MRSARPLIPVAAMPMPGMGRKSGTSDMSAMSKRLQKLEQLQTLDGSASAPTLPPEGSPKHAAEEGGGTPSAGALPVTPTQTKKKGGLKNALFKAVSEDFSMVAKAAKKAGKATAGGAVMTKQMGSKATKLFKASSSRRERGDRLLDPQVIGADTFWDDADETEGEKDDANWEGLEGFQSTPEQSDSERAQPKAGGCPDEKEPEAPANGEVKSQPAAEDEAKRKAREEEAKKKESKRKAQIEWDAKKFGHVRPLQCQSIWDIPTSKEPEPEKAAPSETYLKAIGKAEPTSPKAADATPVAEERGVVPEADTEPAWHAVPEVQGLARTVLLGSLVLAALVGMVYFLVE